MAWGERRGIQGVMDFLTTQERSKRMRQVRSKNTKPERIVRSMLHSRGFRFSLHRRDLPGKPDIVLPKYQAVVFVHGCFWHGHECRSKRPATNERFWNDKIEYNRRRDGKTRAALRRLGWRVFVVWECSLRSDRLRERSIKRLDRLLLPKEGHR